MVCGVVVAAKMMIEVVACGAVVRVSLSPSYYEGVDSLVDAKASGLV
jgi:hypothetical protein